MPFTSGFMLILHFDALLMEHVHVFQHRTSAVVYGSVENTQRRQPKHDRTAHRKMTFLSRGTAGWTHIIRDIIMEHFLATNYISNQQYHGFISGRSIVLGKV